MIAATVTSTSPLISSASPRPASFANTLAAEWAKLATLRSTYLTLGLGLVLSLATTALVSAALGSTQKSWSPGFSPITTSMVGNIFALIVFSVFGVLAGSREYSGGLIRLTLTATPRRGRVFGSKLLLVRPIIAGLRLGHDGGAFLVGQAILGAYGMPVTNLGTRRADGW